jgi:hypothetical protein
MQHRHSLLVAAVIATICASDPSARAQEERTPERSTTAKPAKPKPKAESQKTNTPKKHESSEPGQEVNRAIVGKEQEKKNEENAANPERTSEKERERKAREEGREAGKAVGKTTTTAAEVVRDVTAATEQPGRYRPFALEWSPLGLFAGGRISFNLEWAPATHHAIVVAPHFVHTAADVAVDSRVTLTQKFTGAGGEIGYRYYTGSRGMNGVFIGPSIIGGIYNASLLDGDQGFANIGVAVDVGVQQIFFDHLVVGGGLGLEYLSVNHDFHDLPTGPSTIATSGIKPRFLLAAGYAF